VGIADVHPGGGSLAAHDATPEIINIYLCLAVGHCDSMGAFKAATRAGGDRDATVQSHVFSHDYSSVAVRPSSIATRVLHNLI
jgi:hypothetical protein